MRAVAFSKKQMRALCWWCKDSPLNTKTALICDGAVRSGKTLCMSVSFIMWAFFEMGQGSFAICGKTIRAVRRNIIAEILPVLHELGFKTVFKISENRLIVSSSGISINFYLFGGKDESSPALIQGMTLSGVLFDEVALMPRSFVEQALARCSVEGAKFWFNCNPESPYHWFYLNWITKLEEKNVLYLHFTMEDNPSLSADTKKRYQNLFSGVFYKRFILGEWVQAQGLVYPFMNEKMFYDYHSLIFERWALSMDYGTVNPSSIGLWGENKGCWFRVDEYYFDSRKEGYQRTDEEHYKQMCALCEGKTISALIIDPSAASFIALVKKFGKFPVIPAKNNVVDGIRRVSSALKSGKIKICHSCHSAIKEFSLYSWNSGGNDSPKKENDHAMDDIRYFVSTFLEDSQGILTYAVKRETQSEKGEKPWD